jgi:hypothetical protein
MPRIGVHVAAEIRQPVRVEDQPGVDAARAAAPGEFAEAVDGGLALAMERTRPLGNQNGRNMGDLGRHDDLAHMLLLNRNSRRPFRTARNPH